MNLFDVLTNFIPVALAVLAGMAAGRWVSRPPAPLRPICSCSHGYGQHHEGAVCQGEVERKHYRHNGVRSGYEWTHCACSLYDGPDPVIFGLERFR